MTPTRLRAGMLALLCLLAAVVMPQPAAAATLLWRPYRADVTGLLRAGTHTITVLVTNTLPTAPAIRAPPACSARSNCAPRGVAGVTLDRVWSSPEESPG